MVVKLDGQNINMLEYVIDSILSFEIRWMSYKASNYVNIGDSYYERVNLLKKRK